MHYKHLTLWDRDVIQKMKDQGFENAQIARELGFDRSTIGREIKRNRRPVGFDRDPHFALEVHVIQELRAHLALGQRTGYFEDAVSQRALPMVDVGDDAEVANKTQISHKCSMSPNSAPTAG